MKLSKEIKALPWPVPFEGNDCAHFQVTVTQPVVDGERLLVVTFTINRNNPNFLRRETARNDFRLVCSKKRNRVAVILRGDARTKRKPLETVMHDCSGLSPRYCYPWIAEREENILARWLDAKETENHFMEELNLWTKKALEAENRADKIRKGQLLDEDYTLCPEELPKGLEAWVRREILNKDHTLVCKKGNVRGLCYLCGRNVRTTRTDMRFRQHCIVACPDCGDEVVCVLEGGSGFRNDYVKNIVAAQKGTDGRTVFFRQWHVKRDPTARFENVVEWLEEVGRYAIRDFAAAKWLRENKENYYMQAYRYGLDSWTRFDGVEVYDGSYEFYEASIPRAVEGTRLQFADIQGYLREKNNSYRNSGYGYHDIIRYAMDWGRYPVMEFLWKAGYHNLAFQRVGGLTKKNRNAIRWSGKKLTECFRFPLRILKEKPPADWTLDDLMVANRLWSHHRAGLISESDVIELLPMDIDWTELDTAMKYASLRKIVKYLEEQQQAHRGRVERIYRDYIDECIQLQLDLTSREVLFPRDIQEAHNRTMAQISFEKNKADQEKFDKVVQKLEHLTWEADGFIIRPARAQKELSEEGATLKHCVGGYIQRMAAGELAIFFVRRAEDPDKPFYTLRLQNKKVMECRTTNNRSYENEPEIKAFVEAWEKQVVATGGTPKKKRKVSAA